MDESLFEELFDVFVNRERTGGGDLGLVGIGIDIDGEVLRVDATIIGRGASDAQSIEGQGDDGAAAFVDGDWVGEREDLASVGLFDDASLVDQGREGASGTIDDGGLGGVEFDDGVVDRHAAEGGEYVLDGVKLNGVGGDGRFAFEFGDHLGHGANLGFAKEVGAAEDDAGIGGTGLNGQGDLLAGVKGLTFDGGLFADGALFHAFRQLFTCKCPCKGIVLRVR